MTGDEAEALFDLMREYGPDEFFGTVADLCRTMAQAESGEAPELVKEWESWESALEWWRKKGVTNSGPSKEPEGKRDSRKVKAAFRRGLKG